MVNPRTKGQTGEREIADDLNFVVNILHDELGIPRPAKPRVQRNQNQSAVGGCDLVGTFGLAIEVKRQEQLSINTWWAQCVKSANELQEEPVLLFRQNAKPGTRTKWRCILLVPLSVPGVSEEVFVRAEIEYDEFLKWFKAWAREHLRSEHKMPQRPVAVLPTEGPSHVPVHETAPVQQYPDLYADL